MKSPHQKSEFFTIRILLFVHFFICSIGLFGLIRYVANRTVGTVAGSINAFISYSDWATFSATPTKPIDLVQYVLSVCSLALYYAIVLIFIRNYSDKAENALKKIAPSKPVMMGCLGGSFLLNAALVQNRGGPFIFILIATWFLILALPALPLINSWLDQATKTGGRWVHAAIAIAAFFLAISFYPYISEKMPVANDYMDIPEQTILSTGVVDNTEYINKNSIGGLRKHDPRNPVVALELLADGRFIRLGKSAAVAAFALNHAQKFSYDEETGILIVGVLMNRGEVDDLAKIAANDAERVRIYTFYYNQLAAAKTNRNYSPEQIEFIRKNKRELEHQALAGHYFHHQHTMLGTINEYVLGKPQDQTVFLYGWLSTVVIAEAMKALGKISFEGYQKVFYSFYPAYYLLLLAAAAFIFKKKEYVLLVGALTTGALCLVGFEAIRFAPGFNPVRHFFDIFALVCFYWYLFLPRRNIFYLASALAFSILGILFSKEFGLVLLLSMLATVVVRTILEKRSARAELVLMAIALPCASAALLLISTAKNPTLLYVLLGIAAPPMNQMALLGLLSLFSAAYFLLIKYKKPQDNWFHLSLFWFLYTQGLLIYFVWNSEPNHFWSLSSAWGILTALLLKCWSVNLDWLAIRERKVLFASNLLLVFFLLLPGMGFYHLDQRAHQKIFQEHTNYRWDFPRAKFTSTMDPGVFENAVGLIKKYSTDNSIYILSKYDNILPFLSAKYSAMPYAEMGLSLVTKKEMEKSVDVIRQNSPEYLFVDTDMGRSYVGDVYDTNDPLNKFDENLYDASRGRAMVLENFSKVFKEVRNLYEPVEVGQLITVYKRRSGI